MQFEGFETETLLWDSDTTLVYKAKRHSDAHPVILKLPKGDFPLPERLERFRHEANILQLLNGSSHIISLLEKKVINYKLTLCLEDIDGKPLSYWLKDIERFNFDQRLELAIHITEGLAQIHRHKIIHEDICPDNIIWNPNSGELRIIDFSIASRLPKHHLLIQSPAFIEGALTHISPEQTGRINKTMDYRTDLYSLGVTFYELFSGRLPFSADDPLKLIHCHITQKPAPITEHAGQGQSIPKVLSDVVLKLLQKAPEQRYQSAQGLLADLKQIKHMHKQGAIQVFNLAEHDIPNEFQIIEKLYGREQEVKTLLSSIEHASNGELFLITGSSGVGKSALVREIYPQLATHQRIIVHGKFDQHQRDIPYSALIYAFTDLIHQTLATHPDESEEIRQQLSQALGKLGKVVTDVFPELGHILGPQPTIPTLQPDAAHNRFNLVMGKFIRIFCQINSQLVLFLEDLQWADQATLKLLEQILSDENAPALLIIGTYRDSELQSDHPLSGLVTRLREQKRPVTTLSLKALDHLSITQMIADSLHQPTHSVAILTDIVMRKTGGNPLFTTQILLQLYEDGLLTYAPSRKGKEGRWTYDLKRIEQEAMTSNIIDLMISKLKHLPEETRHLLQLAACLGNSFQLQTLVLISQIGVENCLKHLQPLLHNGLLQTDDKIGSQTDTIYRHFHFLHDRVQQTAYNLINPHQLPTIHLNIGRQLKRNLDAGINVDTFAIVTHLNAASSLITDIFERFQLAELNLQASLKAHHSTAFEAARHFALTGIELLPQTAWTSHYKLRYELGLQQATSEHMLGHHDVAEAVFNDIIVHTDGVLDRAHVIAQLEKLYLAMGRHQKVIELSLETIRSLGLTVPAFNDRPALLAQAEMLNKQSLERLGQGKIMDMVNLPETDDPRIIEIHNHLSNLALPAFLLNHDVYIWAGAQSFALGIRHGNTETGAINYAVAGLSFLMQKELELAYQFAQLAIALSDKYDTAQIQGACYFIFCLINSWKKHFRIDVAHAAQAYLYSLDAGDPFYNSWAAYAHLRGLVLMGAPLPDVIAQAMTCTPSVKRLNHENAGFQIAIHRMALSLSGQTVSASSYNDEEFNEKAFVAELHRYENKVPLFNYYIYKLQSLYLLGELDTAIRLLPKAAQTVADQWIEVSEYHFYSALIECAWHQNLNAHERLASLQRINEHRHFLAQLARNGPDNFQHRLQLIEAELAQLSSEHQQAAIFYDEAIAGAVRGQFTQNEALANERAAKFWLSHNEREQAQSYMNNAIQAYQRWGAKLKETLLQSEFSNLVAKEQSSSY